MFALSHAGSTGNIDLPEAETIRDYTYNVEHETGPFAALSCPHRRGNAIDLPPVGSSSFIEMLSQDQQS